MKYLSQQLVTQKRWILPVSLIQTWLLIDIHLSGKKDGIDIAGTLKKDYDYPYIFLTSNTDKKTVERAKDVVPGAYLVKPFSKEELYTSIEIALSNFGSVSIKNNNKEIATLKQALFIKQKHLFIKVKFDDIIFIKSDHVYIEVISTDNHKYIVRGSFSDYKQKLDDNFIRVHHGYIVNLLHVVAIDQDYVKVEKHMIPIGKNYKDDFLRKMDIR
jgi:two-component system, LytTR family, response regulator